MDPYFCGDTKRAFISSHWGLKRRGALVWNMLQMVLSFKQTCPQRRCVSVPMHVCVFVLCVCSCIMCTCLWLNCQQNNSIIPLPLRHWQDIKNPFTVHLNINFWLHWLLISLFQIQRPKCMDQKAAEAPIFHNKFYKSGHQPDKKYLWYWEKKR